jgi:hypothetical protein
VAPSQSDMDDDSDDEFGSLIKFGNLDRMKAAKASLREPRESHHHREAAIHRSLSWESQVPPEYKEDVSENSENRNYKHPSLRNSGSGSNLRNGFIPKPQPQSPKELKKSPSFNRSPITTPLNRSPSSSSPQVSPVSKLFLATF